MVKPLRRRGIHRFKFVIMAFWNFTPEELSRILDFVNNDNEDVLTTDLPQRFSNLCSAFNAKLIKSVGVQRSRAVRAERTIERLRARLDGRVAEGSFVELDFDVVDLARCVLYIANVNNLFVTRNTLQYILYHAYARWLADNNERLTVQRPVVQEWGPHFWSVSHKIGNNMKISVTYDDYKKISEKNPGVAKFLENVVKKYATIPEAELKGILLQSAPYRNAVPVHAGEKWGKEIKDADIYAWKK